MQPLCSKESESFTSPKRPRRHAQRSFFFPTENEFGSFPKFLNFLGTKLREHSEQPLTGGTLLIHFSYYVYNENTDQCEHEP
jgi:hypothetical protein